jgi:NAD(P)-dependent dehydrogenase (short-subunit alcohol dehydrogenase family)
VAFSYLSQAEKALSLEEELAAKGQRAKGYPLDVLDSAAAVELAETIEKELGAVDVLVNNAGRSIRRSIVNSLDRFHDVERTMALNCFGSIRLTMALLPAMLARRSGHVVNVSTIGTLTGAPRFSAYIASKSALDAWTRCAAAEFADSGVAFTTIHMPLVRTPMIAPTRLYDRVPVMSPDEAATLVERACIERPVRVATPLGVFGATVQALAPGAARTIMGTAVRAFADSEAATGVAAGDDDAVVLQQVMRGVHL